MTRGRNPNKSFDCPTAVFAELMINAEWDVASASTAWSLSAPVTRHTLCVTIFGWSRHSCETSNLRPLSRPPWRWILYFFVFWLRKVGFFSVYQSVSPTPQKVKSACCWRQRISYSIECPKNSFRESDRLKNENCTNFSFFTRFTFFFGSVTLHKDIIGPLSGKEVVLLRAEANFNARPGCPKAPTICGKDGLPA